MSDEPKIWGTVISVGLEKDDQGRTVLRAIVDFYDGNSPNLTFGTIWSRMPVTIVEQKTPEPTP